MRRITAILLSLLLLPGLAMAQRLVPAGAPTQDRSAQAAAVSDAWLVPVWRSSDGNLVALIDRGQRVRAPLRLAPEADLGTADDVLSLDGNRMSSAAMSMRAGTRLYSTVRIDSSRSGMLRKGCRGADSAMDSACMRKQQSWRGGSLAGGYQTDGLLIDVGMNWLQHDPGSDGLMLLIPDSERSSVMGIPAQWIESLNRVSARGSVNLGDNGTRLDMGASMGRINLLPGHARMLGSDGTRLYSGFVSGMDSIDQKAISLGLGKGAISGTIVGRLMQPEIAGQNNSSMAAQQWSAVDLGITVRLPWEGELSLGAQNLWSSGDKNKLPSPDRDPVQSRIPYIQYHQEL